MTGQLETSIVRIFAKNGAIVGTGFLVSGRCILTCAHVVARALGLSQATQEMPVAEIRLDFPLLEQRKTLTAHPIFWSPATDVGSGSRTGSLNGGQDIAGLELDADPPPSCRPCHLVSAQDLWSHGFRAFGFPPSHGQGVWASGVLRGRQAAGWIQIEDLKETGYRVEPGFSGAAVWDDALDGVAGMAVAAEAQTEARAAFIIPTDVLVAAWPFLREQTIGPCPYRGLFAFREEDASLFFGRDTVVQTLVDAVRANPFLGLLGASGSGKSSVAFAGMVPRLRAEGNWGIASFRPGAHPHRALAAGLIPLLENRMSETDRILEVEKLGYALRQGEVRLAEVVGRILEKMGSDRLVLIADQFEELYTVLDDAAERTTFLDLLLADSLSGLTVVITLRADFLGHALSNRALADALQHADVKLGPMNREELQEVVERPARALGVAIEDGLTTRILDAVGEEPGNLPLLEFALTLLWNRQEAGQLTHAAYDAMGGVEEALAGYAEEAFRRLSDEEKDRARSVFVQLVRPGEATLDTRRLAARSEVGESNWELVARLAGARLVVTGREEATGVEGVEIVHEALITHWERLREWMVAARAFRLWQERLRSALSQWEHSNRDEGALLRGAPLAEATVWKARRGEDMSPAEISFIQASESAAERVEREKEATRQRELEHAQELASEQRQRAEQQARYAKVRGRLAIALTVVLVLAIVTAGFAWHLRNIAQAQTKSAQSLRRASLAQALGAQAARQAQLGQTDLAALLARQAYAFDQRSGGQAATQIDEALRAALNVPYFSNDMEGQASIAHAVAVSRDGRALASASDDKTVRLWDLLHPSAAPTVLRGHTNVVNSVAFSPDGKTLASGSDDKTVRLWELSRLNAAPTVLSSEGVVNSVAFSPDGKTLASGSDDKTVRLWQLSSLNAAPTVLPGNSAVVYSVAFSPDSNTLASGGDDKTVRLWDLLHPSSAPTVLRGHEDVLNSVAFSPDGKTLASGSDDKTVRLWQLGRLHAAPTVLTGNGAAVYSVAFSPDSNTLASGGGDRAIRLWDLVSERVGSSRVAGGTISSPKAVLAGHKDVILSVAFSYDGKILASGSVDRTVRLWDVVSPPVAPTMLRGHQDAVNAVAFSQDGKILASGSTDRTVRLWDLSQPSASPTVLGGLEAPVYSLAFSRNRKTLALGSEDGIIRLWDLSRPSDAPFVLSGHEAGVNYVAFSNDGKTLASASDDRTVRLWDLSNLAAAPTVLRGHENVVNSVAFSPSDNLLASGSADRTVRLWDLTNLGAAPTILRGHEKAVYSVAFSPDRKTLASGSLDKTVRLWDLRHLSAAPTVLGSLGDVVNSVTFSHDGKTLATASFKAVGLWDLSHPSAAPTVLRGHDQAVLSVAFSPDDTALASGSSDRTILVLSPTSVLVQMICQKVFRNLTPSEWRQFVGADLSYHPQCSNLPP
jgi:WD40 repeat protein